MKASLLTVVVPGNVRCGLGVAPEYLYLRNVSSFTISIEHYFLYNFVYYIYLFLYLAVLGIHCCVGFCLAGVSRGCSLVGGAWAFVAKHVLQGAQASVTGTLA